MYDYLRERVRLPSGSGQHQYLLENVDFDTGTPIPSAPEIEKIGVNLLAGELDLRMVMMEGMDDSILRMPMPNLEEVIAPKYLNMTAPLLDEKTGAPASWQLLPSRGRNSRALSGFSSWVLRVFLRQWR
jgi:hypothetical protein